MVGGKLSPTFINLNIMLSLTLTQITVGSKSIVQLFPYMYVPCHVFVYIAKVNQSCLKNEDQSNLRMFKNPQQFVSSYGIVRWLL